LLQLCFFKDLPGLIFLSRFYIKLFLYYFSP
jgi:hypothetical protein